MVLLTASFGNMPATHNGSAFTFDLTFSEEFGISYVTLRDDAFSVTDGEVTSARRLTQGSNIGWTITVTPGSAADVTIVLPVTTDCDADGAVCTADGRKLSNRLEFHRQRSERIELEVNRSVFLATRKALIWGWPGEG